MTIFICFLVLEMMILLLVFPLCIKLKICLSSNIGKAIFAVKIWNSIPIILKLEILKERFRISINGKIIQKKGKNKSKSKKKKAHSISWLNISKDILKLVEKVDLLLFVGGDDALSACCRHAVALNLLSIFDQKFDKQLIAVGCERNVLILDCEIKLRVSILDILKLVGEYGNKRNFKTNNRQFEGSHQH